MEDFILNLLDSIGNIDFRFVGQVFIYSLIVFWLVVLYWVWLDSGERTSNKGLRYLYIFLVAFLNIIGWIIYLIIRPSQTIEEIYWSDLERRYLKYETAELGDCPKCGTQLFPGFEYCPKCRYILKRKCPNCKVRIDKKSKYCPYCGVEVDSRAKDEQLAPTKEVMEQQIETTKEEVIKTVEAQKTRYSTSSNFVTKVGESIIGGYKIMGQGIKRLFSKRSNSTKLNRKSEEKKSKQKKTLEVKNNKSQPK